MASNDGHHIRGSMTTSIQHRETQNHRAPFYDDSLLGGVPSPWMTEESERKVIAHYYSYGKTFDWFLSFYSPIHNIGYGFVRLDGDNQSSSWREIDMGELEGLSVTQPVFIHGSSVELTIPVVERDTDFRECSFGELRLRPEFSWINESAGVKPLR